MPTPRIILFDWGNTLMVDDPGQSGPMAQWPTVSAMPGAKAALSWAHQVAITGVATNAADSDESAIRAALARVNLDTHIDHIFCQRSMGITKNDPRFWQAIRQQLNTPAAQILMIGDQIESDVAIPHACGLQVLWFTSDHAQTSWPTITRLDHLPDRLGCAHKGTNPILDSDKY